MHIKIRRTFVVVEDRREEAGRVSNLPLRKVAAVAVVENPFAGRYVEDLKPHDRGQRPARQGVGRARRCRRWAATTCRATARAGSSASTASRNTPTRLLTTAFANPIRDLLGGGEAWISSFTKKGGPGTAIDIPMNHKDDVYVRSHYDGMTLVLPDAPLPDEVAVIFCLANRGRLNARVGGLSHEDVAARKAAKQTS